MESTEWFLRPYCILLLLIGLLNVAHAEGRIIFPGEISQLANELNVSNSILSMVAPVGGSGCKIETGEKGECLALENCPELQDFIKSRNGIHTPGTASYIRKRICEFKTRSANVCCVKKTAPISSSSTDPSPVGPPTPLPSILPSKHECGLAIRSKITRGEAYGHGAHPWLVGVGYPRENKSFQVECGGTLITRRHVLTAAHCFYKEPDNPTPDFTHVILGEHSLSKDTERRSPLILKIAERKEIGYNHTIHYKDISLLVLEREVKFTFYIRPACLPFDLNEEDIDFIKNEPIIAGWGRTYFGERLGRNEPMEAGVSFVAKPECRKAYEFAPDVPLDDTQICFGNDGRDACRGDSGGPLLYRETKKFNRYFLLGIVAFGVECGNPVYPGVYTYVPPYLKWIVENL